MTRFAGHLFAEQKQSNKAIARAAYEEMKKQKKTKIAVIWIDTTKKELSVTDAGGTPYVEYKGTFGKSDADEIKQELERLGIKKVKGKIRRT